MVRAAGLGTMTGLNRGSSTFWVVYYSLLISASAFALFVAAGATFIFAATAGLVSTRALGRLITARTLRLITARAFRLIATGSTLIFAATAGSAFLCCRFRRVSGLFRLLVCWLRCRCR